MQGLDLAAKPAASKGIVKASPNRGGGVLDFPTTRKRLSRKSPGPELRKPIKAVPPPSNVVGPETVSHETFFYIFPINVVFYFLKRFSHQLLGQAKYFDGSTAIWLSLTNYYILGCW